MHTLHFTIFSSRILNVTINILAVCDKGGNFFSVEMAQQRHCSQLLLDFQKLFFVHR